MLNNTKKVMLDIALSSSSDLTVVTYSGETYVGAFTSLASDSDFVMEEASPSNGYYRLIRFDSVCKMSTSGSGIGLETNAWTAERCYERGSVLDAVLHLGATYIDASEFSAISVRGAQAVAHGYGNYDNLVYDTPYIPSVRLNSISGL